MFNQCEVNFIPVFLGGIIVACGNTPPIKIKSNSGCPHSLTFISHLLSNTDKGEYVDFERRRYARLFNVPMTVERPPGFPALSLSVSIMSSCLGSCLTGIQTQRALCAITLLHPEQLAETIDALFLSSFAEHKEIHTPESQLPILTKIFGEDGAKEVLAKASQNARDE